MASNPVISVAKVEAYDGDRGVCLIVDLVTGRRYRDAVISSPAMTGDGFGDRFTPEQSTCCIYFHHDMVGTVILNFVTDRLDGNILKTRPESLPKTIPPGSRFMMTRSGSHLVLLDGDMARLGVGEHGYISISYLGTLVEKVRNFFRRWLGGHEKMEVSTSGKVKWEKAIYAKQSTPDSESDAIINKTKVDGIYFSYNGDTGLVIDGAGDTPITIKSGGITVGVFEGGSFTITGILNVM